jgi:hypothetical protein
MKINSYLFTLLKGVCFAASNKRLDHPIAIYAYTTCGRKSPSDG